jgi:hypothetical protein
MALNLLKNKTKYIKYPLLGGFIFSFYVFAYLIIESIIKHNFSIVDVVNIAPAIIGFCVVVTYFISYASLTPFIVQYNNFAITERQARSYVMLLGIFIGLVFAFVNGYFTHEIIKSIVLFISILSIFIFNLSYYIALDKKTK